MNDNHIRVYDHCYNLENRQHFYQIISTSLFRPSEGSMISTYYSFDLANLGMISNRSSPEIMNSIVGKTLVSTRARCQTAGDLTRPSVIKSQFTHMIYMANLEWPVEWGGHLIILDSQGLEAQGAVIYRPGRVVEIAQGMTYFLELPNRAARDARYVLEFEFQHPEQRIHRVV